MAAVRQQPLTMLLLGRLLSAPENCHLFSRDYLGHEKMSTNRVQHPMTKLIQFVEQRREAAYGDTVSRAFAYNTLS